MSISTTQPASDPVIERYRHIKRGFIYRVLGRGRMQVDGDMDDERMVIYQSESDGQIWCRPAYEFDDPKRFERVDFPDIEKCRVCEREIDFRILKDCHPIRNACVFQERARRPRTDPTTDGVSETKGPRG